MHVWAGRGCLLLLCSGQGNNTELKCLFLFCNLFSDGNKARWGFCNNIPNQGCQTADSNDADAAIGIGLAGQATAQQMGAGWTNYFNSNSPNAKKYKQVWLYVDKRTMPGVTPCGLSLSPLLPRPGCNLSRLWP